MHQFYFPAGLAYDTVARPDGNASRYLYVSNGNADLRYGGGLVQLIDLRRFDCAVDVYCHCPDPTIQNSQHQPLCAPDGCSRPLPQNDGCSPDDIALAMSDLTLPYVSGNRLNPDVNEPECQPDPLDPSVIDCDESPFIVGNAGVRVGNFAGGIRVLKESDTDRRLFVAVRGDPSVTFIDAHLGALAETNPSPRPGDVLNCFDADKPATARNGYNAADNSVVHASGCDSDFVISAYYCDGTHGTLQEPGCVQSDSDEATLPTEPFGMALDSGLLAGSTPTNPTPYSRLLVSSLALGEVTLIDALEGSILNVSPAFFAADPTGRHGAFALAPQFPGNPSSTWYMTSNLQPVIATFRVAEANVIVPQTNFSIGGAFAVGVDVRDISFEPGGNRAFLTENNPPSALVLDTTISTTRTPGQPNNQLVDIVDVCQTTSHMGVRRSVVAGATGTPAHVKTNIYVVCFLSNQVMVVDPDAPGVQDTILVGRGPNEIVFNFGDFDDPNAPPEPPSRRGYFTQYSEMSIGEIDLDPTSPTQNRMVARLGKPVPPPTQ